MIKRNKIFLLTIFIVVSATANLFAQGFTKEEQEILELQDTRTLGNDNKLLQFLNSKNADVKYRALIALANIADSAAVDKIGNILLTSQETQVKIAASFALGEIPCQTSADYLLKALGNEKNIPVIIEILNDLGKVGDENTLNKVTEYESANDNVSGAIALSIARFGLRKIRSEEAINKLMRLSVQNIENETNRKFFAYAFNRAGDKKLLIKAKDVILSLCNSASAETRMWAYSALGKLQDDSYLDFLMKQFKTETDWRVKVNILNTAASLKVTSANFNDSYLDYLLNESTDDLNNNVCITALQTIAKLFAGTDKQSPYPKAIREKLEWILVPTRAIDWQIKAEALKTLAKIFKDEYKSSLFELYYATDNYDIKAEIIRSFGFMDSAMVYRELRDTISADVQRYNKLHPNKDGSMIGSDDLAKIYKAFVDCLAVLGSKLDDDNKNNVRLIFSEFMASRNSAIVDVCLTNLQDSIYLKYRGETAQILLFDYPELKLPGDLDVMQQYIQVMGAMKTEGAVELLKKNLSSGNYDIAKASADALKNITGKDWESKITVQKYRTDFEWDFIHNSDNFKTATINTGAGKIKILLLFNDAPFTSMNFVKLAMKHYFDNTIFHRVVPNFVIQGGDPTGTGYGGPGYSIRSEFTPLNFETGYVGMASGGKDTEGSQFFITHSPAYHLDGKYTIFGKVVEGMNVVDKIQIGDKIESITFSSE
jgi:cyclophilin family peptidyl-prolyl cis-trans isomerase/HEAT repeat protein